MSKRDYDRLPIEQFGRHLIVSGDLDPVYIALHKMELDEPQLHRWLIAYWCLYHCGAACWLSEQKGDRFWAGLLDAASNTEPAPTGDRWPRGHERRHFRGAAARNAVIKLTERFSSQPEGMVSYILGGTRLTRGIPFEEVSGRAQEYPLFGPWIGFKVADMVDRVLGVRVDFTEAAVFMFKDPRMAALKLWRLKAGLPDTAHPKDARAENAIVHEVVKHLVIEFSDLQAPPLNDREIGLQEVETVLCKWKSHMNGHYPLNNDIDEIVEGLLSWQTASETARSMKWNIPPRLEHQ